MEGIEGFWGGIIGAVVIFGVKELINLTKFYAKHKNDKKTSGKKIVYCLLEIRHWLRNSLKIDVQKLQQLRHDYYISKLQQKGHNLTKELMQPFVEWAKNSSNEVMDDNKIELSSEFIIDYNNARSEFALTEPVLAFKLEDVESINKVLQYCEDITVHLEVLFEQLFESPQELDQMSELLKETKANEFRNLASSFNKSITAMAKYCGKRTMKQVNEILNKKVSLSDEDKKGIDDLVGKIDNAIKQTE